MNEHLFKIIGLSALITVVARQIYAGTPSFFALIRRAKSAKCLQTDDVSHISASCARVLDGGAPSPTSYARALYHIYGVQAYYKQGQHGIVGISYSRVGVPGKYAGTAVGYPWGRVAERLAGNAGGWREHVGLVHKGNPSGIFSKN